jgi:hypothetical protein
MKVHFVTPTILSLLDITSMGDSIKREDTSTIGKFDSGLKYALALLLRNNVDISIVTSPTILPTTYRFGTYVASDEKREKELISVTVNSGGESDYVRTGFAKALGHNWELWMALRELYSNMLDEGGFYVEGDYTPIDEDGTIITLEFMAMQPFSQVWKERGKYINETEPIFKISNAVDVLKNPTTHLIIYKQNILVYEDENVPSRYAYNIHFGEIDERRILNDISSVERRIASDIRYTANEDFLREVICEKFELEENEFLRGVHENYGNASDLMHDIAFEVEQEKGQVESYTWIMTLIRNRKDCRITGKRLESVGDHLWSYSHTVTVLEKPKEKELTFSEKVAEIYNFNVDVDVKMTALHGSRVVADKFDNCILISPDFSVEDDFPAFIVEYYDLTVKNNIIKTLSEQIVKLIRK